MFRFYVWFRTAATRHNSHLFINAANLHPIFEFHNILCQKTHFYSTNNAKRHTNLHPTIARNKNRASHENL